MTSEKNTKTPTTTFPISPKEKEEAQKSARKFENHKTTDALKETKIKQGTTFHSPNNINTQTEKFRKHEANTITEHHKNTEKHFNSKIEDITAIILKEESTPTSDISQTTKGDRRNRRRQP